MSALGAELLSVDHLDHTPQQAAANTVRISKSVQILLGSPEEFKAIVKAKIAAQEILVGDEIKDSASRSWIYVKHLQNGKYFLAAKEDHIDETGKSIFTHDEALDITKKLGVQLMNLKMGRISFLACKKHLLNNFKTDKPYWLSDLCAARTARTQWYDVGYQGKNHQRYHRRVRFALEF